MKQLISAFVLLTLIITGCLASEHFLGELTTHTTDLLAQAEESAEHGDWNTAKKLTTQAEEFWSSNQTFLYALLRHEDIDSVLGGFREINELIDCQEGGGEYSAANARLVTEIQLLHEMEQLSLINLL